MINTNSKTPEVYFLPIEKVDDDSLVKLFNTAGFESLITKDALVAIKVHFGETGNNAYLKPKHVKPISDKIASLGGKPFLTDANTLYKGTRGDAVSHIKTAMNHGYCFAPVIIADGLTGKDYQKIKVDLKYFKEVNIASAARNADAIMVMTHFKGHEFTGFGGAIKNLGMGFGSRSGKQLMHSDVHPKVDGAKCTSCELCTKWCPTEAISMIDVTGDRSPVTGHKIACINGEKCIGCAECIVTCSFGAISIEWSGTSTALQEKMTEYALGAVKDKKCSYMNFITEVSPNCDCYGHNGPAVVKDIGVLASFDPVAIDQASVDLANKISGKDLFKVTWPNIDYNTQLEYAKKIGLGSRKYTLTPLL